MSEGRKENFKKLIKTCLTNREIVFNNREDFTLQFF